MSKLLPYVKLPPHTTVHKLGAASTAASTALLRFGKGGWNIGRDRPEGWAIVGDSEGRRLAVETLLSRHRIHPPTPSPGPFPYITSLLDSHASSASGSSPTIQILDKNNTLLIDTTTKPIRHLAFARPPPTGEFTDFTARYGSLQDEDRLSFRETLSGLHPPPSDDEVERVANLMGISHLLDLPFVSFSSGQTRRARIAAGLLSRPVMLILEDPMAGLDFRSRDQVAGLLGNINSDGRIRVVLVLRGKGGDMPDWVTDVCEVRNGDVWIGCKSEWEGRASTSERIEEVQEEVVKIETDGGGEKDPVVKLDRVSVSYGEGTRKVLEDVSWTIKPGDKWHLQGANGSGKTTLLSLILGHHPRSYSLPSESLTLFSKPRRSIPSPTLRRLIGHTSPEIYASFPRGMGLTAEQVLGTGFEGVFSFRKLDEEQKERVRGMLEHFGDLLGSSTYGGGQAKSGDSDKRIDIETIRKTNFSHFPPPQQALLLFLRAVISNPPLLILDEPSQGMDEVIWQRCKEWLRVYWKREGREQAVVVVSHYLDEVPWGAGGKVFKLEEGKGVVE